jgi:SAM-dependent methyltransferase
MLKKSIHYLKQRGCRAFFEAVLGRIPKCILMGIYRFNAWHISAYKSRPYAQAIVQYLNTQPSRGAALEIGCGLGDILRRIRYSQKLGLDSEQEVLNAAAFISKFFNVGGPIQFQKFNFLEHELTGQYDVVVLVNWVHLIDPKILREKIEHIFAHHLTDTGQLIMDLLDNKTYRFNHNCEELTQNLSATITLIGTFELGRSVVAIHKLPAPSPR